MYEEQPRNTAQTMLMLFGGMLIGLGGILMLTIGMLVILMILSPEKVKLIEFMLSYAKAEGPFMQSSMNSNVFEFELSESAQAMIFLLLGVAILGMLMRIVGQLIKTGLDIIKFGITTAESRNENSAKAGKGDKKLPSRANF